MHIAKVTDQIVLGIFSFCVLNSGTRTTALSLLILNIDFLEVAAETVEIHAVAHYKFVGDFETTIRYGDVEF